MNFIENNIKRIKEIGGREEYVPLISLNEDDNGRNFLRKVNANVPPDKEILSDSKSIRDHISARILDKKNHMDYRFRIIALEYSGLRLLGRFHNEKCRPIYDNSTKLLTYPGYGVRCRSFENNDPFKKNHDGLKQLSKKVD